MAGTVRRMMEYLSFAEPSDEEYEDEYVEADETRQMRTVPQEPEPRHGSTRVEAPVASAAPERGQIEIPERHERASSSRRAEVSPISVHQGHELRRIVTVHPSTYNEARAIGEAFREGTPVIMNLSEMGESDAKRMVDFAAGLVFGLHGAIERVTNRVFLLSPASVEVESDDDGDVPVFTRG